MLDRRNDRISELGQGYLRELFTATAGNQGAEPDTKKKKKMEK